MTRAFVALARATAAALFLFAAAPAFATERAGHTDSPPVEGHDPHATPAHGHHEVPAPAPINVYGIHYGKDAHGEKMDPGDEPMSPALAFVVLNFLIFAFILVWKAGPKVTSALDRRHTEIREALAEAGRLREQARAKLEEYRRKVANADRDIATIVEDIKGAAEAEKERVLAQAEAQAEAMRRDARDRIDAELQRARAEIEREVVSRAVEIATELLKKNATPEDHNKLLGSFVKELETGKESRV